MDVFDKMEPFLLEEQRAAENDRRAAGFPRCSRCGEPITDNQLVYLQAHDEYYCLECIEDMTEINEAAEVE